MAETPKYDIHYPDNGTGGAPTSAELGMMAQSVEDALDLVAPGANYFYGSSSDRIAALSSLPNGVIWFDTDNNVEYRKVTGAWKVRDTGWINLSSVANYASGTTDGSVTPQVRRIDDRVNFRGTVNFTPVAVGSSAVVLTLTSTWRPPNTCTFPATHPSIANRIFSVIVRGAAAGATAGNLEVNQGAISPGTVNAIDTASLGYFLA